MKQTILCLAFATCFSYARAQDVIHALGATISLLTGKIETPTRTSTFGLKQTTFTYFPRLNVIDNESSTLSIGAPLGIGLGFVENTFGDDVGIAFAYDLPVVMDFNFGAKASTYNEATLGGYFGAGFGYYKINISKSRYSDFNGATYGPLFRGGVRIAPARENWAGRGLTIGLYYKIGLEKNRLKTFGVNVLTDF